MVAGCIWGAEALDTGSDSVEIGLGRDRGEQLLHFFVLPALLDHLRDEVLQGGGGLGLGDQIISRLIRWRLGYRLLAPLFQHLGQMRTPE